MNESIDPESRAGKGSRAAISRWLPTRAQATRIALTYGALGALWILCSGWVLHYFVSEGPLAAMLEQVKGWFYVSVTALLLGFWLDRYFARIRSSAERLQESESKLHAVGDNLPDSYVYQYTKDETGAPQFTYLSAGVERVHGVSPRQVQADISCLFSQIDPLQRPAFAEAEAESARHLTDFEMELKFQRPDGVQGLLQVRSRPKRTASGRILWDGLATDITARRQAQEALREREEQLRLFVEHSPAAIAMLDRDMRYLVVSRRWLSDYRLGDQNLIGRCHYDVFPKVPDHWKEIHRRSLAGAVQKHEGDAFPRADGSVDWVRWEVRPWRTAQGEIGGLIFFSEVITAQRQLEEQLRQAQKMEAIGQLAGGVAHDFNNILAVIIMQTELTEMIENMPAEAGEGLKEIHAAAERAANLTRQLLLFSRRQVMQPREMNLNEVVTNLARMLQRIIGEDVRLQLSLNPVPLYVRADAGMLDQVLMNLAVNARDAMPRGGLLTIEASERVFTEPASLPNHPDVSLGRYVCLSVTDTGCGIPPESMPRLFEPFFTTKEPGKGTGLGLATVFGIVKQHSGWIEVRSEPGQGTAFRIFIPACVPPAVVLPEAIPARKKPCGGKETILLAEDDSAVRISTRITLERQGYRVLEAANAAEAIRLWPLHRDEVSLLLTDLVMPGGTSGQQLAQRLREENAELKVIFTSGYSADIAGRELRSPGDWNFVQKPFLPEDLLKAVRGCLDGLRM